MLLIFNLGRPDVLPVHDLGVRKGFQFAYGKRKLPEPEQLARYGVRCTARYGRSVVSVESRRLLGWAV